MTTREIEARRYSRRCRQRRRVRRAKRQRIALILVACLAVFTWMCACKDVETETAPTTEPSPTATPSVTVEPSPALTTPTVSRTRDDIISDGRLLRYDLQEIMQDYCDEYGVPYALALAIAEVETHFDPDAVSGTGDYGLMQINTCNHEWLSELGIDVMTYEGNIEAGIYIISQHLNKYGEPELALMAYNSGPTGAQRLWDAGTFHTDYSQKVMAAFEHWTSVLEG